MNKKEERKLLFFNETDEEKTGIADTNMQTYIEQHEIGDEADADEKRLVNELLASYLTGKQEDQQAHDTMKRNLQLGYRIWQLNMFTGEPLPGQDRPFEGELTDEQTQQVNRYMVIMYGQAGLQQGGRKLSQEEKDQILAQAGGWTQGSTLFNEEDRQKAEAERLFADILDFVVGAKNEKYDGMVRIDAQDARRYFPKGWRLPEPIYGAGKGQIMNELQLALHGGGDLGSWEYLLDEGVKKWGDNIKSKGAQNALKKYGITIPKTIGRVQTVISAAAHLSNIQELRYPEETRKYTEQLRIGDSYIRLQIPEQHVVKKKTPREYMENQRYSQAPVQAPEGATTTVSTVLIYLRGDKTLFIELEDNKSILWP